MTPTTVPAPSTARDRLVLPLDVGDLAAAEAMMRAVGEWFGVAKVGMELYAEAGPAAIARFKELGYRVFADLKLHDIPNTVHRAARAHGRHGVDFLNFHTAGGLDMMRAAVEGLREGADEAGLPVPIALGVTVLTSDPDAGAFPHRLQIAVDAGCDGVVCSALEVVPARAARMHTMVPGIRPVGSAANDQKRAMTPRQAVDLGATHLVVGRPIYQAADPRAAAEAIAREAGVNDL